VLVRTVTLVRWCLRGVPQQYVDYILTATMNGGPKWSLPMIRSMFGACLLLPSGAVLLRRPCDASLTNPVEGLEGYELGLQSPLLVGALAGCEKLRASG
jgi:hypothetical protein